MGDRLYVGNLPYYTPEDELKKVFAQVGPVTRVTIITDWETGLSRGFGFVDIGSEAAAREAIERLNGTQLEGRALRVAKARPRRQSQARLYR